MGLLAPGSVIAHRYRLDRLLGQGGMGAVWAATHMITRRAVAMKFLRGPAHARAALRRRFLREARAAAAVRHPNVVEVHDVFEFDDETPVMVMDLLIGETLRQRLARDDTISLAETATLLAPVVSAVGTGHARGVVHRDLKPDNIFLVRSDQGAPVVKVLDFGVAKLMALDGQPLDAEHVTVTGAVVGTPCYMAPEQALAERDTDHRADIWALGVILYECLSGGRPIEGETVGQLVMHLMSTGIAPLARVTPVELPDQLTSLVDRMLSRERGRRPHDLREVRDALSRYTDVATEPFGAPGSEQAPALESEQEAADEPDPEPRAVGVGKVDSRAPTEAAASAGPPKRGSPDRRIALAVIAAAAIASGFAAWREGGTLPAAAPAVAIEPALRDTMAATASRVQAAFEIPQPASSSPPIATTAGSIATLPTSSATPRAKPIVPRTPAKVEARAAAPAASTMPSASPAPAPPASSATGLSGLAVKPPF